MKKLKFAVERAKHYEERTGIPAAHMLNAWESRRDYWYMNYYQDANQPLITGGTVRVFDTVDDLFASMEKREFRCPNCKGVSSNPFACNSGIKLPLINSGGKPETCNWKVYGLFGSLGQGVYVFIKDRLNGNHIFMPVAWETTANNEVTELQGAAS